jgi:hypothetical protein
MECAGATTAHAAASEETLDPMAICGWGLGVIVGSFSFSVPRLASSNESTEKWSPKIHLAAGRTVHAGV